MPLPPLTTDELISTIKRSSLPTILVEGKSDASIYRWIEDEIGTFNGNILPCGGRNVVLELYRRRGEFRGSKVIFLADKDMWLFTSVPMEYDGVIWTNGYSIENDLFTGGFAIECLFDKNEREDFKQMLNSISRWFAFEVEKFKRGGIPQFHKPARILDNNLKLCENFLKDINFSEPNVGLVEDIRKDYTIKIRGKTLLSLYVYILSNPKRKSKYGYENIIELYLKNNIEKSKLNDLVTLLKLKLANWYNYQSAAASKA
jgi:hypothetical protein